MSPSQESMERRKALLSDYRQNESFEETRCLTTPPPIRISLFNRLVIGILLVSLVMNVAQLLLSSRPVAPVKHEESPSKYAHISRSRQEPYVYLTEYSSTNETVQDKAWMSIDDDLAVVALSDDYARAHDLRIAQRFPWDQTKGLYILHGIHNLHCLKNIYRSLKEYRHGEGQSRSWHHISHCLDALRRQVICDADDTPRATDRRPEVVAGLGQYRMCRNWDALEDFAKRHTACYKRPENAEWDGPKKLNRFKHCPEGSGYVVTDDYIPTDDILEGLPAENVGYVE
ncbi:hypothetical protein QQS21_012716 [Conoideocrella luteorostrata]|uniref:Uncharacterized protein n=1 Tax=Conoideocrella luteorostrata TaxID=1105319 RepID=A0AAJ0CBT0_9HYPO|nr:hypothetical protein QQS21_012716 [Conoideocrella luteorostrata]